MGELRFETFIWARFRVGASSGEGSVQNASAGGLFVRSSTVGRPGDPITLSFIGPGDEVVEAIGVVWWTQRDLPGRGPGRHGFGVRLIGSSAGYRKLLRNLSRPCRRAPQRRSAA